MLSILVCVALALAGCGGDDSSNETSGGAEAATEQTEPSTGQAEEPLDAASTANQDTSQEPTVSVPTGQPPVELVENDLVEGTGPAAEVGDEVAIHYVGVGYQSGKEFDSSWNRKPFTFRLGSGILIPGGEQGIKGMRAGGRRELIIPPQLGYGKKGFPPAIATEETLVFVVDLLTVK